MTTEILGFIIIVGAIIVFLARRQLQKVEDDPEVIEASAGRLRYELEQSADEIISRMAGHIDHLEGLLREADYKAELLQQRIDELQRMQAMQINPVVQPITPQPVAPRPIVPAVEPVQMASEPTETVVPVAEAAPPVAELQEEVTSEEPDFSQLLEDHLQEPDLQVPENVEYTENLEETPAPMEPLLDSESAQPEMDRDMAQALEAFREVSKNLEAAQNDMGLHIDISSSPEENELPDVAESVEEPQLPVDEADEEYETETGLTMDEATDIAGKLLEAGYDPDEVGRITGLGRNAIDLLQQIHQRENSEIM